MKKLYHRFRKEIRGSITVFLCLILTSMLILQGYLIDGSKILTAKLNMSSAGEMALNTGLTYYDEALRDIYGMFAVSTTEEELAENMKKAYLETLGIAVGGEADNTAYTDQLLEYIDRTIRNGWSEEETGQLLHFDNADFTMAGVDGTQLSNDYVLKEQILQYMKYRGPALVGYGILEKLSMFKGIKKQQKALDKKLEYEEKMDEVQDECVKAYLDLKRYRDVLYGNMYPANVMQDSKTINKQLWHTIEAVWGASLGSKDYKTAESWTQYGDKPNWSRDFNNKTGTESEAGLSLAVELYKEAYSEYITYVNNKDLVNTILNMDSLRMHGNPLLIWGNYEHTSAGDLSAGREGFFRGYMCDVAAAIGYRDNLEEFRKFAYLWDQVTEGKTAMETAYHNYMAYIESLENDDDDDDDDDEEENKELIEDYKKALDQYLDTREGEKGVPELYGSNHNQLVAAINRVGGRLDIVKYVKDQSDGAANDWMKKGFDNAFQVHSHCAELTACAIICATDLDAIERKLEQLQSIGNQWQGNINALNQGEVRSSMQNDYDNKSKDLNREAIQVLRNRLQAGHDYAEYIRGELEKCRLFTSPIHVEGQYITASSMVSIFENSFGSETEEAYGYGFPGLYQSGLRAVSDSFGDLPMHSSSLWPGNDPAQPVYFGSVSEGLDLNSYLNNMDPMSPDNDEFFKYLERTCKKEADPEEQTSDEKEAEEEAETQKQELIDKGNAENDKAPEGSIGDLSYEAVTAGGSDSASFENTGSKDDKEVSKQARKNNEAAGNFIEQIEQLLVSGRNKLYLSEYAIDMFSYYTVDKDSKGNETTRNTLSNYPITAAHNQMYKAECEYILWGNTTGSADVGYTVATIFGIRFLLNSLYAFTGDAEIRSWSLGLATAIAGWTGFGVPIVQSAIILGLALAETALDIRDLKNGLSVPIYKSANTWICKPSGMGKQGLKKAVAEGTNHAKQALSDKINELSAEASGKTSEFLTNLSTYAVDAIDDATETAVASVLNPLQEQVIGLVNTAGMPDDYIRTRIEGSINGIQNQISAQPDSIVKQASLQAVGYFRDSYMDSLVSTLNSVANDKGITNTAITQKVTRTFDNIREGIRGRVRGFVEPKINALKGTVEGKVNEGIGKGTEVLQRETSAALDNMMAQINGAIDDSNLPDGGGSRTGTSAFTMNYKEYLMVFIAVKCMTNEKQLLQRMGNLIHANLALSETKPSPNFNITTSYTMLSGKGTADLTTTFFAIPLIGSDGGTVCGGVNKYQVNYNSVLGY